MFWEVFAFFLVLFWQILAKHLHQIIKFVLDPHLHVWFKMIRQDHGHEWKCLGSDNLSRKLQCKDINQDYNDNWGSLMPWTVILMNTQGVFVKGIILIWQFATEGTWISGRTIVICEKTYNLEQLFIWWTVKVYWNSNRWVAFIKFWH